MSMVILKNGTQEDDFLVQCTMYALRNLFKAKPIIFYEFIELCKNPDHILFGKSGEELKNLGILEDDYTVHSSIRDIALSAVEGEGFNLRLVDPY